MLRGKPVWVAAFVASWVMAGMATAATVKDVRSKMGSRFEITAVHPDAETAQRAADAAYAEVDRIEAMISSWIDSSETSQINQNAGVRPVRVSRELFNLVRRSLRVSELTEGAFDITFASVGKLWDFSTETPRKPDPRELGAALANVGYSHVVLDDAAGTVFIDKRGTRIGFGAIGKGFAANRAVFALKEHGVGSGIVNAAGDLVAFGRQEDDRPWRIAIADPLRPDRVFAYLDLSEQAVVTSGDYERFIVIDGERFSHILDPKTGYPAADLRSVTIVCPDGELADALATAVSVLGTEKGPNLVNRLIGIEALLVDREGRIHMSANLESLMIRNEEAP